MRDIGINVVESRLLFAQGNKVLIGSKSGMFTWISCLFQLEVSEYISASPMVMSWPVWPFVLCLITTTPTPGSNPVGGCITNAGYRLVLM